MSTPIVRGIAHALAHQHLGRAEMAEVIGQIMDGEATPAQIGGFLIALRAKGEAVDEIAGILKQSIRFGLDHREEAVKHSLQWARGMGFDLADKFVGMYVNDYTLDYGPKGRQAVELLLKEAAQAGIIPKMPVVTFVG